AKEPNTNFEVEDATMLSTALDRLVQGGIDAILMDIAPSDVDGLDDLIKVRTQSPEVPVVAIVGRDADEYLAFEALRHGAQDCLVKEEMDIHSIARSIRYAIERQRVDEAIHMPGKGLRISDGDNRVIHTQSLGESSCMANTLSDSEEVYRDIFYNAQVGLFRTSIDDGKLLECNPRCAQIAGYDSPERCAAEYIVADHCTDRGIYERALASLMETGDVEESEICVTRGDGSSVWVALSAHLDRKRGCIQGVLNDITKKKWEEETLRESEKRYRMLAENGSDVVWTMGMDMKFTYVSPSITPMLGYSVEEAMDLSIEELISPEELEKFNDVMARETDQQKKSPHPADSGARGIEVKLRCKDGELIWAEVNSVFLYDDKGQAVGLVGTVRDISDRKQAEERFEEIEYRYNAILNNPMEIVYEHDINGQFITLNDYALNVLGLERSNLQDLWLSDVLHPEELSRAVELMMETLDKGYDDRPDEMRLVSPMTGEVIWIEVCNFPVNREDEEYRGLGFCRVITDRKRAEQELRSSEQRYRTVFENSAVAIVVLDDVQRIVSWNKVAEGLLGMSKRDLQGSPIEALYRKGEWQRIVSRREKRRGKQISLETKMIKKNGDIIDIDMSLSDLKDDEGNLTGSVAIIKDITERRLAEDALRRSERQLRKKNEQLGVARDRLRSLTTSLEERVRERTNQVEALLAQKDQFVNQLGHDLKTPLTPLVGLLPLVEGRLQDDKSKDMMKVAMNNVNYMKELINKTLEHARLNAPGMELILEEMDLLEEVSQVIENRGIILEEKGIKVHNHIDPGIFVRADKLRFQEVIDNLLTNAVKYTPAGGNVALGAIKEDGHVRFTVADTGIGMAPEDASLVFNEFYKVDRSKHNLQSSGLGLAICKRIVEKHGGQIWAESPGVGKGTIMNFTIPEEPSQQEVGEEVPA
ncbi:MAG: PAS domain S-box protein, partial [Chloroflexota bacterium]|nr:PAS domain S-box protein [Chloroflexota bacterium]